MAEVTVRHQLSVEGGCLGSRSWIVHGVEVIDGRDFAPLDKRDTGLCRFILGSSQKNPLKDYIFFEQLRQRRNHLALDLHVMTAPGKQAWRKAKVHQEIACCASPILECTMPPVVFQGEEVGETVIRMKRPSSFNERMVMEFEPSTLRYIRIAMLASGKRQNATRSRPMRIETGDARVRWVAGRQAYLARRPSGKSKHFPTRGRGDDDTLSRKRARASKWADGDSAVSGSDGDEDAEDAEEETPEGDAVVENERAPEEAVGGDSM